MRASIYILKSGNGSVSAFFVVYEKQPTGDLLFAGRCGLRRFGEDEIELGYCLSERASGRGLATEAANLVVENAFTRVECSKLVALVRPANLQSQRVLQKLGFTSGAMISYRNRRYRYFERLCLDDQRTTRSSNGF